MILFCRYGSDARAPERGFVVAHYDDASAPAAGAHPGCLAVPDDGPVERFGRFGPAPAPMGDQPTGTYPDHDWLDTKEVPDGHRLRQIAGLPVPDNRRVETDFRPWTAPDLTPEVARRVKHLEITGALEGAALSGFDSAALGGDTPRRYPSDADAERKMQLAAFAALAGQSKPGWTATLRCAEIEKGCPGATLGVPHTAAQVHVVLGDYQAFADALHAERDAVEARVAAAATVADILAVARG